MLHQDLPALDAPALHGEGRWLVPAIVAAAGATGALLLWIVGYPLAAVAILIAGMLAAAWVIRRLSPAVALETLAAGPDFSIIGAALGIADEAAALTAGDGSLLVANTAFGERFGRACRPLELGSDADATQALELARNMAWRDGAGCVAGIATAAGTVAVEVSRTGVRDDVLLWRFPRAVDPDPMVQSANRMSGAVGEQLAAARVLAALVDGDGRLLAANSPFATRALAPGRSDDRPSLDDLVEIGPTGEARLIAEGESARPMQSVRLPVEGGENGRAGLYLLFDHLEGGSLASSADIQALLEILPIGLALVDRDGRFLTTNRAFRAAAGLKGTALPVYPGDLVVKEDKGPVADAVRRNARGPAMSGDLAVRLAHNAAEPVALTVAGVRGLGEAAVLLLLKDNSEEAKLKRQIAQATKMQVVGQLAGGVAHDFNNILTAIIGHCDLMLMRHTPGDSDYDDLQQ
ncbi:MAG: PAS domain-containing protein, partial [Sphingomicrobium sp.]